MPDVPALALPELDVVRDHLVPVQLRAAGEDVETLADDVLAQIDVRYSPFNTWYRISSWWEGDFLERTEPGAFKRTLNAHNARKADDAHNIVTLFNHGMDFHIGDKLLGSITRAAEERDSPVHEVDLFDTSYNRDLLPGLRRGAYGSSFMFRVIRDEWNNEPEPSDANPDGLPERTLKEVRVFEAGPVTFPANPHATTGIRCLSGTDAYYDQLARRDPSRVDRLREARNALRPTAPGDPTVVDLAPATAPRTDSALRHSGRNERAARLGRIERERRLRELAAHRS